MTVQKSLRIVFPGNISERLDIFISSREDMSRSRIQKLIREGLVLVNSRPARASCRLRSGDVIELTVPEEPPVTLIPEDIPLDIIFEDRHLIAINKPPGIVIYPAAGHRSGTILNALVARGTKLASTGSPLRPGVVHRLDKETSGVMLFAKDDRVYFDLVRQFREREIEKVYLALVYGNPARESGEIKSLIGRSLSDRKKMSIRTRRGREALTRYRVERRLDGASLVRVTIITGRTHQIRVHFASKGYPVLGDKTYGKKTVLKRHGRTIRFNRQMLHAFRFTFRHPVQSGMVVLSAPLPHDMEMAINELAED
jgi:23S rRNA pseudouridine1911/1915/1917 synthase